MSRYKFGLIIPQGWRWLDYNSTSAVKKYQFSKMIIQLADILGYNSAYVYDHLMGGANFKNNRNKDFFECFTLLSSLLTITDKIRIGQVVTCNSYRHPALLAKMISTMDVISNGRMELGIGAGSYRDEYLTYGYDYPTGSIRINQLDEALNIIKLLWKKQTSTFLGEYYSIKRAVCNPKPIQKPHPPIMLGGTGEKHLLKTVARHADRYNHPFASPLEIRRRLYILKDHCVTIGRHYLDIERSILIRCLIRESEEQINHDLVKSKTKNESTEAFKKRLCAIVGTPEEITLKLHEYIDLGITHFIVHFVGLNEKSLRLFNSKIIKKI